MRDADDRRVDVREGVPMIGEGVRDAERLLQVRRPLGHRIHDRDGLDAAYARQRGQVDALSGGPAADYADAEGLGVPSVGDGGSDVVHNSVRLHLAAGKRSSSS